MKRPTLRSIIGITGFILFLIGLWKFKFLVGLMLISVALSFIGRPIVLSLSHIRLRGRSLPPSIGAVVTLLIFGSFGMGVIQLFAPLITEQAEILQQIDTTQLKQFASRGLHWLDSTMGAINLSGDGQINSEFVLAKVQESLEFNEISRVLTGFLGRIGDVLFGLFSVTFMTFFFLKDGALFRNMIEAITPDEMTDKVNSIIDRTNHLLTRYFGGLIIQLVIITAIVSIGLKITGVENSVLIGLLAGLCNLVPYVGPLAGTVIGTTLALATNSGNQDELSQLFWGALLVFLVAQLVDNFFTQPVVFANRVHAHPLEIFIVISIAGSLAGVIGMVLAVPTYTLFRIIGQELFSGFKLIDRLTQNLR